MLEAMEEVLGDSLFGTLSNVFAQMEVAEEEIAAAKEKWPEKALALDTAFSILNSPIMNGIPVMTRNEAKGLELYRVHCRQLLRNIAEGHDVDRLTLMELSIVLALGSTHTVPPPTELSFLVDGDEETVRAYGAEPLSPREADHWWPVLERWCRTIYGRVGLKPRSHTYRKALRERKRVHQPMLL